MKLTLTIIRVTHFKCYKSFILCKINTSNAKLLLFAVDTMRNHRLDLTKIRTWSLLKQPKCLFTRIMTNYVHIFLMNYITRFFSMCS
jgi:hypothetical protein